ncbi:DUF3291 domain-containing protein [Paraglaciecola arctica]|uniref:DUF3291 domain-containing protein n=1 Tax=Paraglaciecola arctica BSs20135 TaxID=493475 RepID=K6YH71_9ALTE|nr:DUF3291 domain-containing protein [Paraglaciecola arctica]GAC17522.1 hypothetical protein GARC_0541 [Paraglaciecola arctica BSs20135]
MFHLAQVNIGITKGAMDSAVMKVFSDNLDPINAIAEASEGFVWRLKDEGGNATDIAFSDNPNELVNMSVWESVDGLKHFMFKTHHIDFLKRKKEWFETPSEATYVLWWIRSGHIPTIEEAKHKLSLIRKHGETAEAFSFKKVFAAPNDGLMNN